MITYPTTRPQALLNEFKKAIADGDITTWEEDKDGDFTHKATQWRKRAWLRPTVNAGSSLVFTILIGTSEQDKRTVYAYYHGHHIESFINHFSAQFTPEARATPNPSGKDSKF
jgi:hypothetical protein